MPRTPLVLGGNCKHGHKLHEKNTHIRTHHRRGKVFSYLVCHMCVAEQAKMIRDREKTARTEQCSTVSIAHNQ